MSAGTASGAEPVLEPKQPDRSLGELFGDLGRELSQLVRNEVTLAKTEARTEIRHASAAGGAYAAAAVSALLALMFLSAALAWLLDQWINRALAFLIVAAVWIVVGAIAFRWGQQRLRQVQAVPMTVETLKEDVEWMKQQV